MDKDGIEGSAKQVVGKVEAGFGDVTGDAATQVNGRATEAEGVVQSAFSAVKEGLGSINTENAEKLVRQTREGIQDAAAQLGQATSQVTDKIYERGSQVAETVGEQVKAQPLGALVIAGAIGYAIALLLHRR